MIFSHSLLDTYEVCPEQARSTFVTKKYKKTYTVAPGIDIHKAIESRLKGKTPLPEPFAKVETFIKSMSNIGIIECEVPLAVDRALRPVTFWDPTAWFRGKFDAIVRHGRSAFIGDWKTGKVREKADQLERGALLLMASDLAVQEVQGANIWLSTGKVGTSYKFTRRSTLWTKQIVLMETIEKLDPEVPWARRQGPLCSYCPCQDCPNYLGG